MMKIGLLTLCTLGGAIATGAPTTSAPTGATGAPTTAAPTPTTGAPTTTTVAPKCFTPAGEDSYEICFNGTASEDGGAAWYISEFAEAAANKALDGVHTDMDTMWVLVAGILVFFMQAGFSMLEAGCVSSKNVQNILYKNLMDACLGALVFWAVGYGIAYGTAEDGAYFGSGNFLLSEETNDGATYHSFFFQW